ncbi:MAG: protoporphyrinogen oxidase, partial [Planctomycetes bacterium]|nr:protoporphyrinogen oxidase [Planctomycetota bacterium]
YGLFVSLRGGLQKLVDALQQRLQGNSELRLNSAVTAVARVDERWNCTLENGEELQADVLCLCAGAQLQSRWCREFDPQLSAVLASIPYADVATVNIAFPADKMPSLPAAAGFVIPAIEKRHCIACTFSSQKYADRCPQNIVVVRAFAGGALHAQQLDCSDQEMLQGILDDLRDLCGIECAPLFSHVTRFKQAMSQPTIGHLARVAEARELEQKWKSLLLIGNAFEGVGIPDIIAQGDAGLKRLVARITTKEMLGR